MIVRRSTQSAGWWLFGAGLAFAAWWGLPLIQTDRFENHFYGLFWYSMLALGLVVWAEIRGDADVTAFGRRISRNVQRQALTIALLAVGFVGMATLALLSVSNLALEDALFETVSAFGLKSSLSLDQFWSDKFLPAPAERQIKA